MGYIPVLDIIFTFDHSVYDNNNNSKKKRKRKKIKKNNNLV